MLPEPSPAAVFKCTLTLRGPNQLGEPCSVPPHIALFAESLEEFVSSCLSISAPTPGGDVSPSLLFVLSTAVSVSAAGGD